MLSYLQGNDQHHLHPPLKSISIICVASKTYPPRCRPKVRSPFCPLRTCRHLKRNQTVFEELYKMGPWLLRAGNYPGLFRLRRFRSLRRANNICGVLTGRRRKVWP